MILPYVYKVTHVKSGAFYIGFRCFNVTKKRLPEDDLLIKYFTSGSLKKRIQSNPGRYVGEVLFRFGNKEVVYWYEQLLIKENIRNRLCRNRIFIDPDDNTKTFSMTGKEWSAESRKKASESKKGIPLSKEHCAKISKANKGKVSPNKGNTLTKKQRRHLSLIRKGKPSGRKGNSYGKKGIPTGRVTTGFTGRKHTKASKLKTSATTSNIPKLKVKCPHCDKIGGNGAMQRWHFDNCMEY